MSDENLFKVILLGEIMVGKTNLINILTGGKFNENETATSSSTSAMKDLLVKGDKYTIQIWDTIGQEKLRNLTKLFYNNSKIVIFVYDITRKETFEEIKNYWVKDVEEKLGKNIIKGIVANKIDLFLNEQVTQEEGEEYAESIDALFITTSAKTEGPAKFEDFLIKLYEKYLSGNKEKNNNKSVILRKKKNAHNNKKRECC